MVENNMPLVMQCTRNECALACLAMVADWHGLQYSLEKIRSLHVPRNAGTTLSVLIELANRMGFSSIAMSCNLEELFQLNQPSILHWNFNHYVVLWAVKIEYNVPMYLVSDPARGRQLLSPSMIGNYFSGVAIDLFPINQNIESKAV